MKPKSLTAFGVGRIGSMLGPAFEPLRRLRDFFVSKRIEKSDSVVVKSVALYIISNRAGAMMFVTLLILLLASINYEINLGFMATFLVCGVVCVSMFYAHSNLRGLGIKAKQMGAVFANQPCAIEVSVSNGSANDAYAIYAGWSDLKVAEVSQQASHDSLGDQVVCLDVLAGSTSCSVLSLRFIRRGYAVIPAIKFWTNWPLGLFTAWTYLIPKSRVLVYPEPEVNAPAFISSWSGAKANTSQGLSSLNEDKDSLRPYRRGDGFNSILWKKSATALVTGVGDFVVRTSESVVADLLMFDVERTGLPASASLDEKVSRVCAWVLRANLEGVPFGLRAKGQEIAPAHGRMHLEQCLKALALA